MKLGEYRVLYSAYYNYHAVHDVEVHADVWIVEEQHQLSIFGLRMALKWWSEHKEPDYDSQSTIRFKTPKEAFAYVERLLNGNPRNTYIQTVVTEINHERIN